MSDDNSKRRLGRGLAALIGEMDQPVTLAAGQPQQVNPDRMVPIEFVVRGYITGSGWADYRRTGAICGIAVRPGMAEAEAFDEPLFTPATKADSGHDENIDFATLAALVGRDTAEEVRELSIRIYEAARDHARGRGIILADTKFEFGFIDGRIALIDEVLTPDSSRFWPADQWEPGHPQPSFDKEYVREWLMSPASGWDRSSGEAPPPLPQDVLDRTRAKYVEAYERLTGETFVPEGSR